jgi:hypothetical protein
VRRREHCAFSTPFRVLQNYASILCYSFSLLHKW